jgi:hypothetical protein
MASFWSFLAANFRLIFEIGSLFLQIILKLSLKNPSKKPPSPELTTAPN